MKWQSSQFFIQFFFPGFENNNFEPIRFPQQVLVFFYLLIPQFAPFEKNNRLICNKIAIRAAVYFFIDSILPKKKKLEKLSDSGGFQSPKAWKKNRQISRLGFPSLAKNIERQLKTFS
jgi:hypothetical protein